MLITYGTLMRKASILEVGNFNSSLVHTEDNELGCACTQLDTRYQFAERRGTLHCSTKLWKTLERYWRWYVGVDENFTLRKLPAHTQSKYQTHGAN